MIIEATKCWRLDWEELETNADNVSALCSVLLEKVTCRMLSR